MAGDMANAYSNPQLQRAHPPSQIKNEPGNLAKIMGDGLKLIPGSDGVWQTNSFFPEMGSRDEPKPGTEDGTQVSGSTRANHVGNNYAPKLFRHMHTPMQLYTIAYLRAIPISCTPESRRQARPSGGGPPANIFRSLNRWAAPFHGAKASVCVRYRRPSP